MKATAWKRPDGSIALFLLNRSGENEPAVIRMDGMEAAAVLYPSSISTAIIRA